MKLLAATLLSVTFYAVPSHASITGVVVDPAGNPVSGATIRTFAPEGFRERMTRLTGGRERTALHTATTSADGSFSIERTTTVVLTTEAAGFAPFGRFFHDDGPITIVLRRAAPQRGKVTAAGKPLEGAVVLLQSGDTGNRTTEVIRRTAKDGTFEVPDPAVWATSGFVVHPDLAPLGFMRQTVNQKLELALDAGRRIEGTVVDEGGRPVANAELLAGSWPAGKTNDKGEFAIPHAPSDEKTIFARTLDRAGRATARTGEKLGIVVSPAGAFSGRVLDHAKNGLSGAGVALYNGAGDFDYVFTDTQGRFRMTSVAPDFYSMEVWRDGFSADAIPDELDVTATGVTREFSMKRINRLTGRIVNEKGRPVGGAIVVLTPPRFPAMYLRAVPESNMMSAVVSAPDGSFTIDLPEYENVPDSETKLQVVAVATGYAASRSPELGREAFAKPLVLTMQTGTAVRAHVTQSGGKPLAGASVAILEIDSQGEHTFPPELIFTMMAGFEWPVTDQSGIVTIHLGSSLHQAVVSAHGFAQKTVKAFDPAAKSIEIELEVGARLSGRVTRKNGTAVGGVTVFAGSGGFQRETTRTDADGSFTFESLRPGIYEISVISSRAVLVSETVEVPAAELSLQVADGHPLRGTVVEAGTGKPVEEFNVEVTSRDPETSPFGTVEQFEGLTGEFSFDDVPEGNASLRVTATGFVGKELTVAIGGADPTAPVRVELTRGLTLKGRVLDPEGKPLARADVSSDASSAASLYEEITTDRDGRWTMDGVTPGEVEIRFDAKGFVSKTTKIDASATTPLVEVTLDRGISVRGTVVNSDGSPARGIDVVASGGDDYLDATSDEAGRFELAGMKSEPYEISARGPDSTAKVTGFEPAQGAQLRLVLKRRATAVVTGRILGTFPDGTIMRTVSASAEDGESETVNADANGRFRFEKAPAGHVTFEASIGTMSGVRRSSRRVVMEIDDGGTYQVELEIPSDLVIHGTVTRSGRPVLNARVTFSGLDGRRTTAVTDAQGNYEIAGPSPGRNEVTVHATGTSFETALTVQSAARFDIDVTGAALHGRVTADSGEVLQNAEVSLWWKEKGDTQSHQTARTDAAGEFGWASLAPGRYRVLAQKEGHASAWKEVDVTTGSRASVNLTLSPAAGIRIRVFDSRTQRPLSAIVVVRDPAKRIVADRSTSSGDGTATVDVAAGSYLLSVSSTGYGTVTMPVTSPSESIPIALSPGGTLVLTTEKEIHGKLRLVTPGGEEYVRCWCNGIAEIMITGKRTSVSNVTPGTYGIQIVELTGEIRQGPSVSILEGQTSTVAMD